MFNSLGWPEIMVLLVVALFIFGPDRLPTMAKEAAGALKKVRETVTGAKAQIREEFGDEFADMQLTTLNPREFVRRQLMEDDPEPLIKRTSATPRSAPPAPLPPRADGSTPAPYDTDAT